MNEIQLIGSHNSYKQAIDPPLLARLADDNPQLAAALDYAHIGLREQLDLGLRNLELDMFYDPDGGLFADPQGLQGVADAAPYDAQTMAQPGFKVMHVQDIDFRSHCALLQQCLHELADWSDRNPDHTPVFITINAKDDVIDQPGFAVPRKFDAAAWQALDASLRRGLGARLFEPDEFRGTLPTLPDAVARGWPGLDAMRGRFVVVLDHTGDKRAAYVNAHAALRGRAMFVNAAAGTAEAAILIINDPQADFDAISTAVKAGYLVRTRADADTREARSGDDSRMRRAFASGAQIISTDYYLAEPRFGHDFQVVFPDASYVRCNPLLRPDCALLQTPAQALAGSAWRLVNFVSMDDSVGTLTPPASADYLMHLAADGTVSFKLNCNRGSGTWRTQPNASGDMGQFLFGPIASTRAMCPPPNMDAKFSRDLTYVRSFVVRDGRLFLSLFADGGIYEFERHRENPP